MAIDTEKPSVGLSSIAVSDTHGEDSPYFAGWKAYDEDPYDAVKNPSGVIQMGLAENQVSFDLLEEYLEQHPEASGWGSGISSFRDNALFQDYHGLKSFRQAMASFMEQIRGNKVKFDRDLRWRTGVKIIPVHCDSKNNFRITVEALENACNEAEAMNIKIRGLLITDPSNPLGATIERSVLEKILDFVSLKNIHLISDEIYSGSVFSSIEFISVAEILEARNYRDSERVHIVYSLSKDLGLPGFRVGTIYSYNNRVVTTARRMSSFSLVSSQTQNLLASMLSDTEFTKKYIETNRERLKRRHGYFIEGLRKAGIECLKGNAGLFCWMNLTPLLEKPTREGELKLWNSILHEVKLNISPGSSCHCSESGWFRVCFANISQQTLEVALSRIQDFMGKREIFLRKPHCIDISFKFFGVDSLRNGPFGEMDDSQIL
ncbi:1-aminocyclopropane-1-carboxylic acid synthase [Cinnamomum micranthum f. kanehirae]|uniref:1-aminocyclopropane-1-carboxylic acid synthase n=1 Tax=Cinnamomum micranthum f. kanehirae TaxID=337451 RepID=A0A3S3PS59_9MAGN|nr:1-aminocyclopropane-1-carboxylic acid synthase [Cinnamomum micranthum f. kanehirae]